jgi:hypothetical protein
MADSLPPGFITITDEDAFIWAARWRVLHGPGWYAMFVAMQAAEDLDNAIMHARTHRTLTCRRCFSMIGHEAVHFGAEVHVRHRPAPPGSVLDLIRRAHNG